MAPVIGITLDTQQNVASSGRYEGAIAYGRAVAEAGGVPVYLPHETAQAATYVRLCDGLILTGGGDPATESFGEPTDDRARVIDPGRQAFELALLKAAGYAAPERPVLGICLGMQLQALSAGGRLDQFLPDSLGEAAAQHHQDDHRHPVLASVTDSVLWQPHPAEPEGSPHTSNTQPDETTVISAHRQAVADAGSMRVVATAPDGVIEAIDDPSRPFYLGVQWHPERGDSAGPLSFGLIARLVDAARSAT